jgi:hypothetical protein
VSSVGILSHDTVPGAALCRGKVLEAFAEAGTEYAICSVVVTETLVRGETPPQERFVYDTILWLF